MKFLKSLGLVALGVAASRLFPEQVDAIWNYVTSIDAEVIKSGIMSVKDFLVDIWNIIAGSEMPAAE